MYRPEFVAKLERLGRSVGDRRTPVRFSYTNYRGEVSRRNVAPILLWYGSTEHHAGGQWLLDGTDLDKGVVRTFSVASMEFSDE